MSEEEPSAVYVPEVVLPFQPTPEPTPQPAPEPEYVPHRTPDPVWHSHALIDNATGEVVEVGRSLLMAGDELPLITPPEGQTCIMLTDDQYRAVHSGRPHRLEGDELVPFARSIVLEERKAHALEQVDRHAEQARLRFISPGAGQALEYQATEREARDYLDALTPDLDDFPFLAAEVDAIHDTSGVRPDPVAIAQMVVGQAQAWAGAGSLIKRLRRAAKMAIENATTVEEVNAATTIAWPEPGLS
jgi:hypothetical protein